VEHQFQMRDTKVETYCGTNTHANLKIQVLTIDYAQHNFRSVYYNFGMLFFLVCLAFSHINQMGPVNVTQISKFLLLGFSEYPRLQPTLFGFFPVPSFCAWQTAHHPGYDLRLPPAHTHIHLYFQHLFHIYYCSKDDGPPPDTEQGYNLCRLHHPNAFFCSLLRSGQFSTYCDGL
jgi:hypothetical protein